MEIVPKASATSDSMPDDKQYHMDDEDWKIFDDEMDDGSSYTCSTSAVTPKSMVSTMELQDDKPSSEPFFFPFMKLSPPKLQHHNDKTLSQMQADEAYLLKKHKNQQRMERNRLSARRSRAMNALRIQQDHETIRKLQGRVREMIGIQDTLWHCVRNLSNQFLQVANDSSDSTNENDIQMTVDSVSDLLVDSHDRVLDIANDPALIYRTNGGGVVSAQVHKPPPPTQFVAAMSAQEMRGMSGSKSLPLLYPPRR